MLLLATTAVETETHKYVLKSGGGGAADPRANSLLALTTLVCFKITILCGTLFDSDNKSRKLLRSFLGEQEKS